MQILSLKGLTWWGIPSTPSKEKGEVACFLNGIQQCLAQCTTPQVGLPSIPFLFVPQEDITTKLDKLPQTAE